MTGGDKKLLLLRLGATDLQKNLLSVEGGLILYDY